MREQAQLPITADTVLKNTCMYGTNFSWEPFRIYSCLLPH